MATFNGAPYVREQLTSILEQIGPDDEVVVSDDDSTDGTVDVVEAIADSRIRVLRNSDRLGYSGNFERALQASTGSVVFIADQDDVWLPGRVKSMAAALADADLVVADATVVDESLAPVSRSHFAQHRVRAGFLENWVRTRYIGSTMAVRRALLDSALPLPPNRRLCAYDYWLAIFAEAYFRVALVEQPSMLYRRHGGNASTGGAVSSHSLAHKVRVRLYCLWHLAVRWRSVRRRAIRRAD